MEQMINSKQNAELTTSAPTCHNTMLAEVFCFDKTIDDLPEERWVSCFGLEGYYEVSNLGRIKSVERVIIDSLGRNKTIKTVIISQIKIIHSNTFSLYVRLSIDTCKKNYTVASLILNSFKQPDRYNKVTHHINFCSFDNRLQNLTFEELHNKRQMEFIKGIRNGMDNTEHWRKDGTLKERASVFFSQVLPKNTKTFTGRFQKASCKYPVTIYFADKKEVLSYSSVRNCSDQTGITEQSLRNALRLPHKYKRFSVKKGVLGIGDF